MVLLSRFKSALGGTFDSVLFARNNNLEVTLEMINKLPTRDLSIYFISFNNELEQKLVSLFLTHT